MILSTHCLFLDPDQLIVYSIEQYQVLTILGDCGGSQDGGS